ncbi:MAG: hypothetical protein NC394_00395 [Bacteroides sp.]|nr:hypothetical protein [Bacteroides sp.]
MLKYGSWDLPGVDYFLSKNSFKGSKQDFRFVVFGGEELKVCYWLEDICFELAKDITEKEFPLNEQSLYDINEYLTAEYKAFKKEEV